MSEEKENEIKVMTFEEALTDMKNGHSVTRVGWKNPNISLSIQRPDENSKMTKPYIYMTKGEDRFPCDLSCESIMAEDWIFVK